MMIAQFNGFELSTIHAGDAWKICDLATINSDRLSGFFQKR